MAGNFSLMFSSRYCTPLVLNIFFRSTSASAAIFFSALALGGVYDLVCHGHSHERVIEQVGETLRVNPGEVMGRLGLSTYALYETSTGQAEIVIVEE